MKRGGCPAKVWVMRTKTPPSLKWLIDRRARLLHREKKLEEEAKKRHRRAAEYEAESELIRRDIAAFDQVLSLHEIRIDPKTLRPKGTQKEARLLPWNHLTRNILACLRLADGDWCSTSQIMAFITAKARLRPNDALRGALRLSIRKRLQGLHAAGRVVRRHAPETNQEGYWSLPKREET